MTKEELRPIEPITSPQEFMNQLYTKTIEWLESVGGNQIKEYQPQAVEVWERHPDFHKGTTLLSLNLLKGCAMEDSRKVFVLTLGHGWRGKYSRADSIRLQFGFLPIGSGRQIIDPNDGIEKVKWILNNEGNGKGEIDVNEAGEIEANCWVTHYPFVDPPGFNALQQEEILTSGGLEKALFVIQDCVRRAYSEDLT